MKVVLVTGASSGFGKSIAELLVSLNYRVYGTSRSPQAGTNGVNMLELDVNIAGLITSAVAEVISREGRIDVLINNAGVGLCGAIEDTSIEEARRQMETNFLGPVQLVQEVLPYMRDQGEGRVIHIGSLAGKISLPYQSFYSASKFALEALNASLRLELASSGIQSTLIAPGDFKTGFTQARVFSQAANSEHHADRMARIVSIYERDELNGAPPELVAELCARLITAPRVKPYYSVGRMDQRLAVLLKGWLPARWMEAIVQRTYQI